MMKISALMRAFFPARAGLLACVTAGAVAALAATGARAALPIQTWTAPSGAKVLLVESRSIPMIDLNIDFDAGSRYDPPGKAGLALLTAGLLDAGAAAAGGRPALTEAQIADRFADVGAMAGTHAGRDAATVTMRTLSSRAERDAAVDTMAQFLQHPTFPDAVLKRESARLSSAIAESDTKPEPIAEKAFRHAIYGGHPYGVSATVASVSAIRRDDLVRFYRDMYSAKRAVVTIVGDIDRAQAEKVVATLTEAMPAGVTPPAMPAVAPLRSAVQIDLPHPAEQAHIVTGQASMARSDPDYFPLLVGNYVLGGGGFVSRLTAEVREKRGLTYGVSSAFVPQLQEGPFEISLQTRREQAREALNVVRETLDKFVQEGPTDAEMQAAKDNLVNGFPLRLDSNRKLLANVAAIGFYNLPLDYLDTWTEKVKSVTAAQVRDAFARHVRPDRLATVVVGPGDVFGTAGAGAAAPGGKPAAGAKAK
ncbi:insulinase family protein [Pandoraea nosoerga]|uniref:Zinc protease n=1 Tax=Pandoraea nosoerga TaxID=2508296 RepID=A0A5E4RT89_9BURK|nr:insulinase family protein [Pandoraea nosoerga]MBN4674397.1 insulinase family protein [Pandoraea nosoerga]MBN4679665.1 insulinase family protein [Pandoraea nosoerga]MBN4743246.1 insulinase family protein [Pandoraea nosoerga]VVD65108.1 zinc protease [Pandoraea nosoerga]